MTIPRGKRKHRKEKVAKYKSEKNVRVSTWGRKTDERKR
jgi:hypothetical protein